MKQATILVFAAFILAAMNASAGGSAETPPEPLIGTWNVAGSEPRVSSDCSFVFSDDGAFAIYGADGLVLEKDVISATTDHSFLASTVHASEHHPVLGTVGSSRYALYELSGSDRLTLRFYDDERLETLRVTFELERAGLRPGPPVDSGSPASSDSTAPTSASRQDEDFLPVVWVDFDRTLPDRTFFRNGGRLEVVSGPAIGETRMGMITLPAAAPGTNWSYLPKASFVIDYHGKLADTVTSYRTYVPGEAPYGARCPYVVYAVTVDDDPEPEAFVVGRRIVDSKAGWLPEDASPVRAWVECRMDAATPVHVANFRENLGGEFTTWNYGPFGDLVKTPLRDERAWGELDIVYIEICAGVAAGPPFRAYVDDIEVGTAPIRGPAAPLAALRALCRDLSADLAENREGILAIPGFVATNGEPSRLIELLDGMMAAEIARLGKFPTIGRERIEGLLKRKTLTLVDLMDVGRALELGKLLGADYILTGVLVEMPSSVVVLARIIDVATGQIEALEQADIEKTEEVEQLLSAAR
jgi:hypothetical protein